MKRRLRPDKTECHSNGIEDDIAQHPELASLCLELQRVSQRQLAMPMWFEFLRCR